MDIYTADIGVKTGALLVALVLKGTGGSIPTIQVGEKGRGRELGVLPVGLTKEELASWEAGELKRIEFGRIGTTRAGSPKLFSIGAAPRDLTDEPGSCLVVFTSQMGYRGGNGHTGDYAGWKCSHFGCEGHGGPTPSGSLPEKCPVCGGGGGFEQGPRTLFHPWPCHDLVKGIIAQGDAGRMGCGEQKISIVPPSIFRVTRMGRLYGGTPSMYYKWDGEHMLFATWDERVASDLF